MRQLQKGEEEFLKEMLYEAIYLPPHLKKNLSRDIVLHPDLVIYSKNWGRTGDIAVVAEHTIHGFLGGYAWGRLFTAARKGYGYIGNDIPEISVAVVPCIQNKGIGTRLIRKVLEEYYKAGISKVSLSVSKENPSINLYYREGFKIYAEGKDDFTMINDLIKLFQQVN